MKLFRLDKMGELQTNKSQITNLEVEKYQSETPRVEISIRAVNIPKI